MFGCVSFSMISISRWNWVIFVLPLSPRRLLPLFVAWLLKSLVVWMTFTAYHRPVWRETAFMTDANEPRPSSEPMSYCCQMPVVRPPLAVWR
jgi:hypothetical protein